MQQFQGPTPINHYNDLDKMDVHGLDDDFFKDKTKTYVYESTDKALERMRKEASEYDHKYNLDGNRVTTQMGGITTHYDFSGPPALTVNF